MAAVRISSSTSEIGSAATDTLARDNVPFLILHEFPSPGVEKIWREFLNRIDSPAHHDSPEYFLVPHWIEKMPFVVLALDHQRVIGVLSGIHSSGNVECGLPARPQVRIDEGADALLATRLLAEGLLQEAHRDKLITIYAWNWVSMDGFERQKFLRRELEGNVVLDLRLGSEALYKQAHENRRRNIRAAIKNEIEVREATTQQDLAEYWTVYSAWRITERKKIVHDSSFATIEKVHNLRENHRRFLARYNGKVIAATGLRFQPNGLVEYANNCSLDEFMHLRPNDLLIWRTIEWACEQGFTKYSLGGAHPFLRKSGGTVVPICRYRLDRTFLHRHDLKDSINAKGRALLRKAPAGVNQAIRKLLRKQ
jgi:hypothetical protein